MLQHLPDAVQSALNQTDKNFELIILDDGSRDGTRDYLETVQNHSKIRILYNQNRLGLCKCRNRLLNETKGEYISILDADDELFPEKVFEHGKTLDQDPQIGMVWGRAFVVNQEDDSQVYIPSSNYQQGWDLTESYQAVHSATTWRKSALLKAGGYDPYFELVEDADMYLKVGDFSRQVFQNQTVAMKRLFPQNEFRKKLNRKKIQNYSQILMKNTVSRRYGDPTII